MMMMGEYYYCGDGGGGCGCGGWMRAVWNYVFIIMRRKGREKGVRSGRRKKKKRVIIERRGNVDVDASGAPPCKAGVVSKWQMVRLR